MFDGSMVSQEDLTQSVKRLPLRVNLCAVSEHGDPVQREQDEIGKVFNELN